MATFLGDLGLTNFVTADLLHYKDFVQLDGLTVSGIKSAFHPNRVEVKEVSWTVEHQCDVQTNNVINLLTVLPKKPSAGSNAPPSAAPAGPGFPARWTVLYLTKPRSIFPTSPSSRTASLTCRDSTAASRA